MNLDLDPRVTQTAHEFTKFGAVGGAAYVVDVGLFNLLLALGVGPLTSKTVAVVAATTWAYLGNRHWAFGHRGSRRDQIGAHGEYVLFFLVNGIGLLIALACLWASYYLLGFTSTLSQNIAANGVGFILGMLFRFWAYRTWVFPEDASGHSEQRERASTLVR
jgi:putative flippase GtrA